MMTRMTGPDCVVVCNLTNAHTHLMKSSKIGEGGGSAGSVPGMPTELPLQETGLHDLLHGRQAWSRLNSFHKRGGQIICPREGNFRAVPSQNGGESRMSLLPPIR